jgi:hypothetical protein
MNSSTVAADLDGTVPLEYRAAIIIEKAVANQTQETEASATSEDTTAHNTESSMPTENTTIAAITTPEKIAEIARAEAHRLMSEANKETAIADRIAKLSTEVAVATASISTKDTEISGIKTTLTASESKVAALTADLEKATASLKTSEMDKVTLATAHEALKADFAKLNSEVTAAKAIATVSNRTDTLKALNLKSQRPLAKAIAKDENGVLKMSDADFVELVEDLKELAPAAAKTEPTPAPATAPAKTEKEGTETAPAAAATSEVTEQATATNLNPFGPDLSDAGTNMQAVASMLAGAGAKTTASGVKTMAEMFTTSTM